MTPYESREAFLDSVLSDTELKFLKTNGLYQRYVYGEIDIETIYQQLRDQGI